MQPNRRIFMKALLFVLATMTLSTSFAATLTLGGGEAAVIQANVSTRVSCGGGQGGGGHAPGDGGLAQCYQDNSNLRVQLNQLQNDLFRCQSQSQNPKVWNCTYTCSGNNGMGSHTDKATACRAAKDDSGAMCASQCECEQN